MKSICWVERASTTAAAKIPLNRIGQKQSSEKKEAYYKFIQFEKLIPFESCLFWIFSFEDVLE